MGDQQQKAFDRRKVTKRRRVLFWTLGVIVLLLLFVIVSQQLWLWNIVPLESASDTVVLYALSTLNFIAFVVFSFISQKFLSFASSAANASSVQKSKRAAGLLYWQQAFCRSLRFRLLVLVLFKPLARKWLVKLPSMYLRAREVQREAVARNIGACRRRHICSAWFSASNRKPNASPH